MAHSTLTERRRLRLAQRRTQKTAKLGAGARFKAVAAAARAGGARDPEAVAAAAGRKKLGAKRFARMAALGRRRARRGK